MQIIKTTSISTGDRIGLAETQISLYFLLPGPTIAALTRKATLALCTHVQTGTASYVVLRRYLPKLQSHQEALILLSGLFCQREADWLQHPVSSV